MKKVNYIITLLHILIGSELETKKSQKSNKKKTRVPKKQWEKQNKINTKKKSQKLKCSYT